MDKEKKKLKLMEKVSEIADELALGYVERLRKSVSKKVPGGVLKKSRFIFTYSVFAS